MALIRYENEYARLKKVVLYRPHVDEIATSNIKKAMYSAIPDPVKVLQEFDSIVKCLRMLGIETIILEDYFPRCNTPNMIFLRDNALTYADQLFIGSMKHQVRSQEPIKFQKLLLNKLPQIKTSLVSINSGTFEGADLLVEGPGRMAAYTGNRTNKEAIRNLQTNLPSITITDIAANINEIPQHLLGGMHIIDKDLLARRSELCQEGLRNYQSINFSENREVTDKFSLNIVTIGPREILMPANCPATKQKLESYGVKCHEVTVNEIHKMGGGLACMVLPLYRE